MDEQSEIESAVRADYLRVESGSTIHDKWSLHTFAFEQDNDWMPTHLRRYHPDRFVGGELMEGYYDEFIPQSYECGRGQVVKKRVDERTMHCPDCEVAARKYDGDTICPECGMICSDGIPTYEIIRDPKTAGRVDSNGDF